MLITVADERCRMPANSEVISIIRKTAKVMPTSKRGVLGAVVDQQLVGDVQYSAHRSHFGQGRLRGQ